jgi:type IV secretory pathway ATPase VirB11/archaellum biosynthesis ATPase
MTLLLGPPSSGKTTLLLALAGKLDPKLKVRTLKEDTHILTIYHLCAHILALVSNFGSIAKFLI